ncbi:MAG: VOC family protein [Desulfobaccales bacterium]
MAVAAKPIPEGYHTITPYLVVQSVADAMAFYQKVFGATERYRLSGPDGKSVIHGELQIGDSIFMLGAEDPSSECKSPLTLHGSAVTLYLYVDGVDAFFNRAVAAGAKAVMPVQDMFWGDRVGTVEDPFGHRWSVATHTEDLSPEETTRRAVEFFSSKA